VSLMSTNQLQQKFQNIKKKLRGKALRIPNNDKNHFCLSEMGASWRGGPPTVVGPATALEEVVVSLPFGAMSTVKIFEEDERKAWDSVGSMKSLKALKKLKREFRLKKTVKW